MKQEVADNLIAGYEKMAADKVREMEALEWTDATCGECKHYIKNSNCFIFF